MRVEPLARLARRHRHAIAAARLAGAAALGGGVVAVAAAVLGAPAERAGRERLERHLAALETQVTTLRDDSARERAASDAALRAAWAARERAEEEIRLLREGGRMVDAVEIRPGETQGP